MSCSANQAVANPVHGRELRELLDPLPPDAFLNEYWGRKPLYVRGTPGKFGHLFDWPRFYRALALGSARAAGTGFRIHTAKRDDNIDGLMFLESITPEEVDRQLAEGTTICVNDIGAGDEALSAYAQTILEQISYVGAAWFNCYASPDGSGADTHFDARISTTLQISGSKRWSFSQAPAIAWPTSNAQVDSAGHPVWMMPWVGNSGWDQLGPVDQASFTEVVLNPGDLLCLPAGTWHSAKAIGPCLALNLTFCPKDFFAFLVAILQPALMGNAGWRGGLPPVCPDDLGPEGLPPAVKRHVAARLRELRAYLETLDADDPHIDAVWRNLSGH